MRNAITTFLGLALAAAFVPVATSAAATPSTPAVNGGNYVEIGSTFTTDAQYEAWFTITRGLRIDFDQVCGDTFCEGEYSNIQPLRFQCSAQRITGRIGTCAWSFAASDESIDARSGRIVSQAKAWQCITPLTPGTTVNQLLAALAVEHPLEAPLPASSKTVYDGLVDCL